MIIKVVIVAVVLSSIVLYTIYAMREVQEEYNKPTENNISCKSNDEYDNWSDGDTY